MLSLGLSKSIQNLFLFGTKTLELLALGVEGPSLEHLTEPELVLLKKYIFDDLASG